MGRPRRGDEFHSFLGPRRGDPDRRGQGFRRAPLPHRGKRRVARGRIPRRLVATPDFPAPYKAEAEKGAAFLHRLGQEKQLNWTFLSPSALFDPGNRTGKFRLGGDQLLVDPAGKSWISFEDFAIATADEIERPVHIRVRFTVGY
jgi:putative NADH-flavin reductase